MYKICFYVPASHVEIVKAKMFLSGAGKTGCYSSWSWQVLGEGQFLPLEGSEPNIGKLNELVTVSEYKVETICADEFIHDVIKAFKTAHPYEEPAYQVWKIENI